MSVDGRAACAEDQIAPGAPIWTAMKMTAFAVLMFAVCWASVDIPRELDRVTPIWPSNAIVLSVLLTLPSRRWASWLAAAWIGALAANFAAGDTPTLALALSACNMVEVLLTAVVLRRLLGPDLDIARTGDLVRFALIAGLLSPVVAAMLAALVIGGLRHGDVLLRFEAWVAADGLGAVIVTPLILTLRDARKHLARTPLRPMGWLSLGALAATAVLVFSLPRPMAFLIMPPMLFVVFQLELLGAALAVLIVLTIAVGLTLCGLGPMAVIRVSVTDKALVGQAFLAALTLTSFPTAAVLAQRRRLQSEVAAGAARTAELYRRALLAEEVAQVGYWRLDLGDRLTWSDAMFTLFALPPSDPPDARLAVDRIHPEDRAEARQLLARALRRGEECHHQFRLVWPGGEVRHLLAKAGCERDAAGAVAAVFGTVIDITELKQAEAELRAAREAAEAAAAVKSEFLANMSHELRTPLTSVLGFTRLALEQPDLTDASRGYIAKASNAGAALLSTVNDILDFSKLESGRLQIRRQPSDPAALCAETLELFSEHAAAKGLSLRFEAGTLPGGLAIDPDRVRQLLLNLIGNAVKFSDAGEIVLAAAWRPQDQTLAISVRDQGPGIAAAQQPLLFRRFSQVDGSSTRRHDGSGLGLAICLGLVEAMGGRIGVESEPGRGARFFFEIPAAPAGASEAGDDAEPPIFPPGVRVLVADDHAANRQLVRAVLEPLGAAVSEAVNGAEAAAIAGRAPFDLILMDLRMPELDGLGAMRAIRAGEGPNRTAPILAFSAGADAPTAEGRRQAGFDGDLSKPLLPADLILAVALHARARPDHAEEARRAS
ncbi:MAG: ATP-binding protein [Caulobacteraceae bacterium]|nr:ATP-binding protein [Caulobacteraceae bacterium]